LGVERSPSDSAPYLLAREKIYACQRKEKHHQRCARVEYRPEIERARLLLSVGSAAALQKDGPLPLAIEYKIDDVNGSYQTKNVTKHGSDLPADFIQEWNFSFCLLLPDAAFASIGSTKDNPNPQNLPLLRSVTTNQAL
jgi:hypothetical protein